MNQNHAKKTKLYDKLKELYKKYKSKHIVHILGDFNARIQIKASEEEACIGKHTFNKNKITLESQTPEVEESRNLLIDLCQTTGTTIMNTQFQKPDSKLATYRKPNNQQTELLRHNYEMIDYWMTISKGKTA